MALILMAGAIVGARVFYLAERGQLLQPGQWLGTTEFTFYGGFIGAAIGLGVYMQLVEAGARQVREAMGRDMLFEVPEESA